MSTTITTAPESRSFPRHPEYQARYDDWVQVQDCYEGARKVKAEGTLYLPPTESMRLQGMGRVTLAADHPAQLEYNDYRVRAQFPGDFRKGVVDRLNAMHRRGPAIDLPPRFEQLRRVATVQGESIERLLRNVNEQQLVTGRIGLLVDPVDGSPPNTPPLIATYVALSILNWQYYVDLKTGSEKLSFVALDESAYEMDERYAWTWQNKTRLLRMNGEVYETAISRNGEMPEDSAWRVPAVANKPLNFIPFLFVGVTNVGVACPPPPPLLDQSERVLAAYRKSADLEQTLHKSGQDTLLLKGRAKPEEDVRVGAGSVIDVNKDGDAKYIGISGVGITAQQESLDGLLETIASAASSISARKQAEAADALRQRIEQANASLMTPASAGGEAVEIAVRWQAEWLGGNPEDVTITPNFEFADEALSVDALERLVRAELMGDPKMTRADWFRVYRRLELIPGDVTDEEQEEALDTEAMERNNGAAATDLDPLGADDDEDEDEQDDDAEAVA